VNRTNPTWIVAGAVALGGGVAALAGAAGGPALPAARLAAAAVPFAIGAALLVRARVPAGVANALTLTRLVIVALGAGVAACPGEAIARVRWGIVAAALVDRALDGLDGPIARRLGEAGPRGAAFDGETDALATLVLSILAVRLGAPAAALGVGLARYLMLAAAAAWPRLRGSVPSSLRAKIVCDANLGALILLVSPLAPAAARAPLAWAALAAAAWSFSFDLRYLLGRDRIEAGT
jgi:phosphatidylglycerophosphate synthase